MSPLFFEQGQMVAKEMTNADHILIVVNGCCELYTEFEGNEFVIERVYKGGIINSRSFLMEDMIYCNIRAVQNTRLLQLSLTIVNEMK
jgi:CRP-like cAMP-binding protein